MKKIKKCMEDTFKLKECCDIPVSDEEDQTCQEHLEGIEEKEGKEKHEAFTCFSECKATEQGYLVEGDMNVEKMKEDAAEDLKQIDAEDLIDLATESIDYCKEQRESDVTF